MGFEVSDIDKEMEASQALVGFILSELYPVGLNPKTIVKEDFQRFNPSLDGQFLINVVIWMEKEKLIYSEANLEHNYHYRHSAKRDLVVNALQLSSKGIQVLKSDAVKPVLEDVHSSQDNQETSLSNYNKIGELVGSMIGGLTKSITS